MKEISIGAVFFFGLLLLSNEGESSLPNIIGGGLLVVSAYMYSKYEYNRHESAYKDDHNRKS